MGRRTTCNEILSAESLEFATDLWTTTNRTNRDISDTTGIPVAKLKHMFADLDRPAPTRKLSDRKVTDLLMGGFGGW